MSNVVSFNTCLSGYLQEIFLTARQFPSYILQIFSLFKKNRKELELKKKTIIRLARNVCLKTIIRYFFLVRYIQILQQHFSSQGLAFRIGMQGMKRGQQMPKFHLLSSKNDTVYSFHPYMPSQKNLLITKSRFLFFIFMIWRFKEMRIQA